MNDYSLENDKVLFIHECRAGLEDRLKIVPKKNIKSTKIDLKLK